MPMKPIRMISMTPILVSPVSLLRPLPAADEQKIGETSKTRCDECHSRSNILKKI